MKWWQLAILAALLLIKLFSVLCIVLLLCILVHEIGHLAGDLIVGFRLNYIRVGPLRVDGSGEISWHWTWHSLTTGSTNSYPAKLSGIAWRRFVGVAAGPVANLATAYCVFRLIPEGNSILTGIAFFYVGLSTFIGFVNLIPSVRGENMSDGMQLWILLFSRKRRKRLVMLLTVISEQKRGNANALGEQKNMEESAIIRDGTFHQVAANWLAYAKAEGAKDHVAAGQYLENCLLGSSSASQEVRERLIVEAARFQVFRRRRPDLSREWLELAQNMQSTEARALRFLPEAVVLCQEKQYGSALKIVEEGVEAVRDLGTKRPLEEQALEAIGAAVQKHLAEEGRAEMALPVFE